MSVCGVAATRWRARGLVLPLTTRPLLMAVVNCTPDSFSDGGQWAGMAAVDHALDCVDAGASIVDIGGESTRPGAQRVPAQEQITRTAGVVRELTRRLHASGRHDVAISIDTTLAAVAQAAIDAGANIVNDVSAATDDESMARLIASEGAGVVLMHRVAPSDHSRYSHEQRASQIGGDVVSAVCRSLLDRARAVMSAGVDAEQIALDPGLGFGKTVDENLALVHRARELVACGHPIVVGASRKSFVGTITGEADPARRVAGSVSLHQDAAAQGVQVLRVHDVAEHARAFSGERVRERVGDEARNAWYLGACAIREQGYTLPSLQGPQRTRSTRPMAGTNTLTFNDTNFQAEVLDSDKPVLVDFWAEWCGPCRMLGPTIDELANDYAGRAKVGKLDVDSSREWAMKLEIQSIPTVMVFKGGKLARKFIGIVRKSDLATAIDATM